MKNIFIIHGAFGSPEENWIPWLQSELEGRGYSVTVPVFPTPEGQNYANWMRVIESYLSNFDEETVLLGHSIGATFALSILEKLEIKIKKTILVSGFLGSLDNKEFEAVNHTISEKDFLWGKINQSSKEFSIFHGDNDPYVPTNKATELGLLLDTEPIIIPEGGHLNEDAGFRKFPQLLKIITD